MTTRKKVIYGILLILIALVIGKYGKFIVEYIYFGVKGPSVITRSDEIKWEPEKVAKKEVPYAGLSIKGAVVKKKYQNYIYIKYTNDIGGTETGDILKLEITPKTFIWKDLPVPGKPQDKVIRIKLKDLPVNAYISLDGMTNFEKDIKVKYIWWSPGFNQSNGYL